MGGGSAHQTFDLSRSAFRTMDIRFVGGSADEFFKLATTFFALKFVKRHGSVIVKGENCTEEKTAPSQVGRF